MSDPSAPRRHADLDAIRVGAIALLHLFHTGMMFNLWRWHVKNAELLPALTAPWEVLSAFRMPLLMVVAGAGTALALRRRSLGAFTRERLLRLGLPLLVGIFVIVPPQIWVERVVQGVCSPTYIGSIQGAGFQGSFWSFYPSVFQMRPFPEGNTSWHHLWFVAYLLVFCLLALPLFRWLGRPAGTRVLAALDRWFAQGFRPYLLWIPLALVQILLRHFPQTGDLVRDPRTLAYFGLLFLYGHLLIRCPALGERVVALRKASLGLALLMLAALLPGGRFPFPFEHLAVFAFVWLTVLAVLGFARRHVTVRGPWLAYAQEVAYPFYLLHQTAIVLVGFWLLQLPVGPWPKLGIVFAASFALTAALCEGIRRTPLLRPLFGMKPAVRSQAAAARVAGHTA